MRYRLTALFLLAAVMWIRASASTDKAVDCCLRTTNKKVPFRVVTSFSVQTMGSGCRIPATVLVTRRRVRLCAPPASGNNWVTKLIKRLSRRERINGRKKPSRTRG